MKKKDLRAYARLTVAAASLVCFPWPGALAQAPATGFAPEMAARPAGGPVKGARYVIDPTHTFVMYEMGHYGTTTNRGRFSTKDGIVRIDETGKNGKVDIVMDMSSINTGVDLLNRHVQSKDFLNIAEFPTGRFVADKVNFSGDKVSESIMQNNARARPGQSTSARSFNACLRAIV